MYGEKNQGLSFKRNRAIWNFRRVSGSPSSATFDVDGIRNKVAFDTATFLLLLLFLLLCLLLDEMRRSFRDVSLP